MGIRQQVNRVLAGASDVANPILVKETRQALKSRQFVATFMLLLVASWLVSCFFMLISRQSLEFGPVATRLFYAYYLVLAFATFVVVPFGAYRSMLNENEHNTYELLSITTLTPRQIVWGKLLSALLQLFIYYSAISPFIAFTALLNGFDLASFSFVLLTSMYVSLALSMLALMSSTFARQRHWQGLSSLLLLGGLVWTFFITIPSVFGILQFGLPFEDPDFWWAVGAVFLGATSYLVLFQQVTTAQLTFESGNRSTGIRVVVTAQFLLYGLVVTGFWWYQGVRPGAEELLGLAAIPLAHITVVSLFLVTEADTLSRRIRRGLPQGYVRRTLLAPLLPGGARGLMFLLLHLAAWVGAVMLVVHLVGLPSGRREQLVLHSVWLMVLYPTVYLGVACLFARWGTQLTADFKPAHARLLTILGVLASLLVPFLPRAMEWVPWRTFNVLDVLNPVMTAEQLSRSPSEARLVFSILGTAAAASVLMNLMALSEGLRHVVRANVQSRSQVVPPPAVDYDSSAQHA